MTVTDMFKVSSVPLVFSYYSPHLFYAGFGLLALQKMNIEKAKVFLVEYLMMTHYDSLTNPYSSW